MLHGGSSPYQVLISNPVQMITFKISENQIPSSHFDDIIVNMAYISGYRLGLSNYSKALWGLGLLFEDFLRRRWGEWWHRFR